MYIQVNSAVEFLRRSCLQVSSISKNVTSVIRRSPLANYRVRHEAVRDILATPICLLSLANWEQHIQKIHGKISSSPEGMPCVLFQTALVLVVLYSPGNRVDITEEDLMHSGIIRNFCRTD